MLPVQHASVLTNIILITEHLREYRIVSMKRGLKFGSFVSANRIITSRRSWFVVCKSEVLNANVIKENRAVKI